MEEAKKEYFRDYYQKNKPDWYRRRLKNYFGMTLEEFYAIMQKQDNRCAICGAVLVMGRRGDSTANVDHDHATGRVRGILCKRCNIAIGYMGDSVEVLKSAIRYLEQGE